LNLFLQKKALRLKPYALRIQNALRLKPCALRIQNALRLALYALHFKKALRLKPYALRIQNALRFKKALRLKPYALRIKNALRLALYAFRFKKALRLKPYALRIKNALRLALYALSLLFFNNSALGQCCIPDNSALRQLVETKELSTALVGVYVYDDSSKKEIADYQGDKYFVPASNTKLFSLYAGMKYLGDSLVGIRYSENDTAIFVYPTGDPSLLHPDFQSQPVVDFLRKSPKKIYLMDVGWMENALGVGWAWDDYNEDYAIERSALPVYGNFIRWNQQNSATRGNPAFGPTATVSSSPEIPWKVRFSTDSIPKTFLVQRLMDSNVFIIRSGIEPNIIQDVPFITNNLNAAAELLPDTIGKPVHVYKLPLLRVDVSKIGNPIISLPPPPDSINSRPADSVFIPMMHRSDNFFAEQTLLMVSQQHIRWMNDELLIKSLLDTIMNGPLADLPQKPSWVDGSGLSRFNLFSPRDFVSVLIKLKNEFGMDRMKKILPTGGSGTLKNYYRADSGYVFVKTGSLTGVLCLSGYIYTTKKHLLELSILVNNHNGGTSAIRRAVEAYVEYLRKNN
jgi:serine-type D-Ala-D-Ala carboxypeptidase/endopeptidase (penicillin-binding protein 4)